MKHDEATAQPAPLGQVERGVGRLVEKLRDAASAGFDEWRVQDPVDGNLLGGG